MSLCESLDKTRDIFGFEFGGKDINEYMWRSLLSPLSSYCEVIGKWHGFDEDGMISFKSSLYSHDAGPMRYPTVDVNFGSFVDDWENSIKFLKDQLKTIGRGGFKLVFDRDMEDVSPRNVYRERELIELRMLDFSLSLGLVGHKPSQIISPSDDLPTTSVIYWLGLNPRVCAELGQGRLPSIVVPGIVIDHNPNLALMISCKGEDVIIGTKWINRKCDNFIAFYDS